MSKSALYTLLTAATLALYVLIHCTLNVSESEPVGLYRLTLGAFKRGSLVLLRDPLKRLVGVPGDVIRTTPQGSFVNGSLIANSRIPAGTPYRPYPFGTFVLQPDQFFVLGDHPLSYDSRYFGPIPGALVASRVEPVWTEGAHK